MAEEQGRQPTVDGAMWVVTDQVGTIVDIGFAMSRLLNVSIRHLRGRNILLFMVVGRQRCSQGLLALRKDHSFREKVVWMPRNRGRFTSDTEIAFVANTGAIASEVCEWTISQVASHRPAP